jgi:hypothetical protein
VAAKQILRGPITIGRKLPGDKAGPSSGRKFYRKLRNSFQE